MNFVMNFVVNNWQFLLCVLVAFALLIVLVILYHKNKISAEYLQLLSGYLDTVDDGESFINKLAEYAKKAVCAVEQMVKAGLIPKSNSDRKEEALDIIERLAEADGVELDAACMDAASDLIEVEVFALHQKQ